MRRYGDEITAADLPSFGSSTSRITDSEHTLELGRHWQPLHLALARHGLPFLASGGSRVVALDDGARSSGRHFTPAETTAIVAALEQISDDDLPGDVHQTAEALHHFLADAVEAGHGLIVYLFP